MNKLELVDVVAAKTGATKVDAGKAVEAVVAAVAEALKKGDKVAIQGFGTFDVKVRAARKGTHPKTGAVIDIPASKTVGFKAGKGLKDSI